MPQWLGIDENREVRGVRRRARHRAKGLVTDPTTALDLTGYTPIVALRTRGNRLWETFVDEPPFWWDGADLAMASMLCAATDAAGAALESKETSPAAKAAIVKEWRSLAGELGLSPTSRGRLKMSEAQSAVAAKKVEAIEDERGRRRVEAMNVDEFGDD